MKTLDEYYKDYLNYFSKRLAKLRMEKGVSAREMSLSIGQSAGYIGQMERMHSLPSMSVFFCICDYLRITPKEFFDEGIEVPTIYLELMNNIKNLDREQLLNINNIVKSLAKSK